MDSTDRLADIFAMRSAFLYAMKEKLPHAQPDIPITIASKEGQQYCRDIALRGVEEMFEALQHLKNWKTHRVTDIPDFNREEFLEEVVDAFNYFFSLLILVGFDADDLYQAYCKKDKIIHDRIQTNY